MKCKRVGNFSTQPLIQESRQTPILLLEGDNYDISSKGISKTLYRMRNSATYSDGLPAFNQNSTMVEEIYDMNKVRKTFILRRDSTPQRSDQALDSISIQEIGHGIEKGHGTGCTTWESSIVMSMYFSKNPELLKGKVIELGSGIGLGGMLTLSAFKKQVEKGHIPSDTMSFTFTDCSQKVMEQCKTNLSSLGLPELIKTRVISLNWHDFVNPLDQLDEMGNYDSVIASDVAYDVSSIKPLCCTMTNLLRPGGQKKIHIFGPNNRAVLHDLINELKRNDKLNTSVEIIEMERLRLKAKKSSTSDNILDETFLSKKVVEFAHVIVSHRQPTTKSKEAAESYSLIDLD